MVWVGCIEEPIVEKVVLLVRVRGGLPCEARGCERGGEDYLVRG